MRTTIISVLLFLIVSFICLPGCTQTAISNNGKFVTYKNNAGKLVIYDTRRAVIQYAANHAGISGFTFSADSKYACFLAGDTLYVITPENGQERKLLKVRSYVYTNTNILWIDTERKLHHTNPDNFSNTVLLEDAGSIISNAKGDHLVAMTEKKGYGLWWLEVGDSIAVKKIATLTAKINKSIFNLPGNEFAFTVTDAQKNNSLWIYDGKADSARRLTASVLQIEGEKYTLCDNAISFSGGDQILFYVRPVSDTSAISKKISVDVWSYTDAKLQTRQIADLGAEMYAASVTNLAGKPTIRLIERKNELLYNATGMQYRDQALKNLLSKTIVFRFAGDVISYNTFGGGKTLSGDYILNDYNWNKATMIQSWLVNLESGSRQMIEDSVKSTAYTLPLYEFSSSGNYFVYYNQQHNAYYSYEISTGASRNLTSRIPVSWKSEDESGMPRAYFASSNFSRGIVGWISGHEYVLIADHFGDIWKADLQGVNQPVNITHATGRSLHYSYRLWRGVPNVFGEGDSIVLETRNRENFIEGFAVCFPGKPAALRQIITANAKFRLLKALSDNTYLMEQQNPDGSSVLSVTQDLIHFAKIHVTAPGIAVPKEIVRWRMPDGKTGTGILFKPFQTDPAKKYPMIVSFYENVTSLLINNFTPYDATEGPYVPLAFTDKVSYAIKNGYVVFYPDINYSLGDVKKKVTDIVLSGVNFLCAKLSYIDKSHIGISGNSFGAYQAGLLLASTNLFKAGFLSSGHTDIISHYLGEEKDEQGYSYMAGDETGQNRLGATLWERPDLYIRNSPVFYADRIQTPVLMMSNQGDNRVPFSQGVEFFKALRRLGKPCWLLQYDGKGHSDFSNDLFIRAMQFFDHYLKGAPAPVWMSRGVPARLKGKTLGYEYDTTIKTPGAGLLMENDAAFTPQQKELLKHKTTVTNDGRIVDVTEPKKKTGKIFPKK